MEWVIQHGRQRAVIDQRGGGLRRYEVGSWSVIDGYRSGQQPPGAAGQVLAPWPNRIRDGRYRTGDGWQQLPVNELAARNAIHGLVRDRPWVMVDRRSDSVRVDVRQEPSPGYPFDLTLSTIWSLGKAGLTVRHRAVAQGRAAAPFGLGVHPYLRVGSHPVDDLTLSVPATRVLETDDRHLPLRLVDVADRADVDFRRPRPIRDAALDHAYTALTESVAQISAGSRAVELHLGEAFRWVQVFTGDTLDAPRRRRAVAMEPMTCPPDAFNSGTDLVCLEPGTPWDGEWRICTVE